MSNIIKEELQKIRFIKKTDYGENEIYSFSYQDSPVLMNEIGRIREITFRAAGGGTGKEIDIDKYDIGENPFRQLLIWSPSAEEIIGGYRYKFGWEMEIDADSKLLSPAGDLFTFTPEFHEKYTRNMVELGRSFVIPEYQATGSARKGLAALDNLWDGIGFLIAENLDRLHYFFGKFTMYKKYDAFANNLLMRLLEVYFGKHEDLCYATNPVPRKYSNEILDKHFTYNNIEEDFKVLHELSKQQNEMVPPLVNSYVNLTKTMKFFGTAPNIEFGDVEESAILLTVNDMNPKKYERYITTKLEKFKTDAR